MIGMGMGIDFGSYQTVIATPQQKVVLQAPTVISVDTESGKMIAHGAEAYGMIGRSPDSISVIQPVRDGTVADYEHAETLLRCFVQEVCRLKMIKPRAVLAVSADVTEVEQRSLLEAATMSGIRQAVLLNKGLAAAIGAGVDVGGKRGHMVIHLGAGTTDVTVLSLNGIAVAKAIRIGSLQLDEAIIRYVRSHHTLVIGARTAETIKHTVACAFSPDPTQSSTVPGRSAMTGLPQTVTVTAPEIMEAIGEPIEAILAHTQSVLEVTSPELAGDIMENGILLTGGGAKLKGIAELFSDYLGVTCRVAEEPECCVAVGAAMAVEFLDRIPTKSYDISEYTYQLSQSVTQ